MPQRHAKFLKVDLGQLSQNISVNFVLAERGLVLSKAKASQPTPDIHARVLTGLALMIVEVKQRVQGTPPEWPLTTRVADAVDPRHRASRARE